MRLSILKTDFLSFVKGGLFVFSLFSLSPCLADDTEKELPSPMDRVSQVVCMDLLSQLKQVPFAQFKDMTLRTLHTQLGLANITTPLAEFENVVLEYATAQQLNQKNGLFIAKEIERLLKAVVSPGMTPDNLKLHFERLETEMAFLKLSGSPSREKQRIDVSALPLDSSDSEVQKVIRAFESVPVPIYSANLPEMVHVFAHSTAWNITQMYPDQWQNSLDSITPNIFNIAAEGATTQGLYLGSHGERGAIFMPSYFNMVDPTSCLIHEISHSVQDAHWDMTLLWNYFLSIRSQIPDKSTFATPQTLPFLVARRKYRLLHHTGFPDYFESVFKDSEINGVEWVVLSDLATLLYELDANDIAERYSLSHDRPISYLEPENLFSWLVEKEVKLNSITATSAQIFSQSQIWDLLSRLRSQYRNK